MRIMDYKKIFKVLVKFLIACILAIFFIIAFFIIAFIYYKFFVPAGYEPDPF